MRFGYAKQGCGRTFLKSHFPFPRSAAQAERPALSRRFNRPVALRALLWGFIVMAIVFSSLPLLRYLGGQTIFDYGLWYATGKHVLAGDEIYFFRSGKYDFMYPPP